VRVCSSWVSEVAYIVQLFILISDVFAEVVSRCRMRCKPVKGSVL